MATKKKRVESNNKDGIYKEKMNENWQGVCTLFSSALFGTPLSLSDKRDWSEILNILYRQGVVTLSSGSSDLISSVPPAIQKHLKTIAEHQILEYYHFLTEADALTVLLASQDISFVLLKGLSIARYYPHPEYRTVGDIDFLIPPQHFDSAKFLLLDNGYVPVYDDHSNDRHFVMEKNGITYEMHRYFSMPKSKVALKEMDSRLHEAALHAEIMTKDGCSIPCLPKLEDGLVILQHISQHIQVGLTLKQVLDWIMYVARVCDDTYWNDTFSEAAGTYGLRSLALTVARMGQMYFGLPTEGFTWCSEADDGGRVLSLRKAREL